MFQDFLRHMNTVPRFIRATLIVVGTILIMNGGALRLDVENHSWLSSVVVYDLIWVVVGGFIQLLAILSLFDIDVDEQP